MDSTKRKPKIKLSLKRARKDFKDRVNFVEMRALKKKRRSQKKENERCCEESDWDNYNPNSKEYDDTSSIEDRKRQFRYIRKLNDTVYRKQFERKTHHAGYGDSIADQYIQRITHDYSFSYCSKDEDSEKYVSDDTLDWVENNIDLVRNRFKFYEEGFKNRGIEYLDDPDNYSKVKICGEISPDVACEIYSYCDNPRINEELYLVMTAYFNFWGCEGKVFEEGLGKSRYNFFQSELERINKLFGGDENQPKEENIYMTAPMRCMTYYIHNPSKLHKRYLKVEKMRADRPY